MARPRRYKRYKRISLFKFKLKKQTVYTIFAVLLIALSTIAALSFTNKSTVLALFNKIIRDQFGWGGILLPLILASFSLLFLQLRVKFAKPNVSFGLLLSYICFLAITRNGTIGAKIWNNFSALISDVGAFIVLLGMFIVGIIVLFNTSIDEVITIIIDVASNIKKQIAPIFPSNILVRKPKSPFDTKLLFKPDRDEKDITTQNDITDVVTKPSQKTTQRPIMQETDIDILKNTIPQAQELWQPPPLSLLSPFGGKKADRGDVKQNAYIIEKTLESFGISAKVVEVNLGPAVTQYALEIAVGTKLSKITALSNDLALALAAPQGLIRIEAPIPGRRLVGIEVPNRSLEFVTLAHMLSTDELKKNRGKLVVAVGLDVTGNPVTTNIAKMPHVLIAGTTGSGKSVLLNSWISSLLFRTQPTEVKLILIDPKRVEFIAYDGIPHLLTPVIFDPRKILSALKWVTHEMDKRYKLFSEVGVRNIDGYNDLAGFQSIPYIVIFIDELADLMAYAPVEIEDTICRIAQMARATGIHLVISTQRPSTEVITGLIKANIPARIAFNVSSMIDSRVIIDLPSAEKLLGRGDMLYVPPDQAKPTRIQGTFISEQEIKRLVEFLKNKNKPVEYTEEVTTVPVLIKKAPGEISKSDERDLLFEEAIKILFQYDRASASLLQRRLSIGYARAARILDQLELEGIVGPAEGSKPREVLKNQAKAYFADKEDNQAS